MYLENCFKGKSIIVTGSGRGIGRALTVKLDSLGGKVYAISKNPVNLASLTLECSSQLETICVDLGDWESTRKVMENIGPVDCLVNNAAVCSAGTFMTITPTEFDSMCNVNLKAVINVSQVVTRKMIDAGKNGSVVNLSSVAGLKGMPIVSAYSILKGGLDQLTSIMALELGPHKIRVNSIHPGGVKTDMFVGVQNSMRESNDFDKLNADYTNRIPMRTEYIGMEDVVNSILFYLSDLAPVVTGTMLAVDGGFCLS